MDHVLESQFTYTGKYTCECLTMYMCIISYTVIIAQLFDSIINVYWASMFTIYKTTHRVPLKFSIK